jgi:GntR family transcriptional regulator, arabinose operon transcriptional repressor
MRDDSISPPSSPPAGSSENSGTNSTGTKHEALTQTLQEMAASLKPGDRFPSQTELMRRFAVSDRTVLRSLEDLRRAGWIVRRKGSGTFVADPAEQRPEGSGIQAASGRPTIAALALSLSQVTFYKQCVDELSRQAQAAGLSLVCQVASDDTTDADSLLLEALEPTAFVLFSYYLSPIGLKLVERGHRVVVVGAPPAGADPVLPSVYADHEHGGYEATRYLLDLGHRRIAFCFKNPKYPLQDTLRWQGHRRALEEARGKDRAVVDQVLYGPVVEAWRDDPEAAAHFFARKDAPTGIVAWSDSDAIILLGLLHRAGVRVPEDVSVIGFNAAPEGELSIPPLTTVDQFAGRQMHAVMDLLSRPSPPRSTQAVIFVPTLVPRASCAVPRS